MISWVSLNWRCIKKTPIKPAPLYEWMKKVPDPRCERKKMHDSAEILTYIIMAYLNGRHSLRRALNWAKSHLRYLRKYMTLENGIASVSTVHRLLKDIDEEDFNNVLMQWMAQLLNNRKLTMALDGKGLRGATDRVGDGKTPYVLNVLDVERKLLMAQLPVSMKSNEITGLQELLGILDLQGNLITIDAIGTQWKIMDFISEAGGYYLFTVKENQQSLKKEITGHFRTVLKRIIKGLTSEEDEKYSHYYTCEKNRSRLEYRDMKAIQANPIACREELAFDEIKTIGLHEQVRIPMKRDKDGNDVTPEYEEFKAAAIKKKKKASTDQYDDEYVCEGIITNKEMTAEEMAEIKRGHWAIENSLHHVLDDLFGEDRSSARVIKNNLSLIRKICFNILQLAIQNEYPEYGPTEMMDVFSDNSDLLARYIFEGIPEFE